jgi:hypothetical protein
MKLMIMVVVVVMVMVMVMMMKKMYEDHLSLSFLPSFLPSSP